MPQNAAIMPTACTCGAPLPEDARFCHRCGKPQREELLEPEPAPRILIETPPSPPKTAPNLAFGNPLALRTALLVASATTVLEMIPFAIFVAPILGGFATVMLYQRRSGQALSPGAGAKVAWLSAIFNSLLLTVLTAVNLAVAGSSGFDGVRDQMRKQAMSPDQQQVVQMLNNPVFLAFCVLIVWVILFAIISALYMAGGAMGARFQKQKTT
jgi:hypothetical protein